MLVAYNASSLLLPLTGVGHYTRSLARAIQAERAAELVFFYASQWSSDLVDSGTSLPGRVRRSAARRALRTVMKPLGQAPRVGRALQQWRFTHNMPRPRPEIYHEPNFLPYRFDGPTVVTVHDLSWIHFPETQAPERVREMQWLFPQALKRASHFITVSEFGRRDMIETLGIDPDRITAVPNGVSANFAPRDSAACGQALVRHGLTYGQYVLCVGTLEPRKNLEVALRAHARLPTALQRELPLAVVGMKGWRTSGIEQALAPRVEAGTVRPLGYVEDADLPSVYAGALALVYPSIYEGFGLPPLEAMACGAPVIVSNRSSLPEVVDGAGILIEPDDESAIAETLMRLREDPEFRAGWVARGLERARQFSWERSARETLAVYRQTLERAS